MRRLSLWMLVALAWAGAAQKDVAYQWNDEGLAAAKRGANQEAEALYQKAMKRWRELGPGHEAHFAITELNMAQAQCAEGRRAECEKSLEGSLAILRRTLGVRNDRTLTNINVLAGVALMRQDADYAERLFDEALPVEREFYPHDLQLARTLGGLAAIRTNQGKPDAALPLAEEALSLTLETEGENSVDAAMEYSNVAEVHRIAGRLDRALPLYGKAREIYEKTLGPEHPRVGCVLSEQGLLLMAEHKYALADDAVLRARKIMDKSCPACGFEQSLVLGNLGVLRLRQDRLDEADRLLTRTLKIEEHSMQKPGSMMATTLEALALLRKRQRRFDEAERLSSRAAVIMSYR
jgi:tetratricopeptide (TPR) repeat protein